MLLTSKLRRIALNQQGLLKADSFGHGKKATLRAIKQLGYLQIDTISVVERAHHHVVWSRVSNYKPELLEQLVTERQLFEYWFHAASWLPMSDYRFALPRMANNNGERNWFKSCDQKLLQHIIKRIKVEGPLRARDFKDTRHTNSGWWDWKPAKQALEQLFMQGELMVSRRDGFQKVYDLPERVLPDWVDTCMPGLEEYASHLIDNTLRAHGFATFKSMSYLRKGQKLRNAIKEQLVSRLESDLLTSIDLGNNNIVYFNPALLEARTPRSQARVSILSPFDNVIIQRQRVSDIFNFNFQVECYLPEFKRQYGYFSLPILYRDRFVGRIDCKAHRAIKSLEVKSLTIEKQLDANFVDSFHQALLSFSAFNGCQEITFASSCSNDFSSIISRRQN